MRAILVLTTVMLASGAGSAMADCAQLRFGYVDQHRPPYYLGNGAREASPAGASVDLVRDMAGAAGCTLQVVRLPVPRIRPSLELGTLDAAPIDAAGNDTAAFAFPLDKNGNADRERALQLVTIMFVRTADKLPASTHPAQFAHGRRVGANHGAPYAEALRKAGMDVDDGALDTRRNMDKLLRGRIDAYVVTLANAGDLDAFIDRQFGGAVTRLDAPIRTTHIWLAVNKSYYGKNRQQIDAMWNWLGTHGRRRFAELLRIYEKE